MKNKNRAVVFLAWGDYFMKEVSTCLDNSKFIDLWDVFIVTDENTEVLDPRLKVIRHKFSSEGLLRKTELLEVLPDNYDSFLFLDSDTVVLENIELGFVKSEEFGIAIAPAPHYSLDYFWGFESVMKRMGVPLLGQNQYNTGVIFFTRTKMVEKVFELWRNLANDNYDLCGNDQPYFSLAMEILNFNPYALTPAYNYRGFGDGISGKVRIWHSHGKCPKGINDKPSMWPPRGATPSRMTREESRFRWIYRRLKFHLKL